MAPGNDLPGAFFMKHDWFEVWFDSPYYHMLYKHRDNEEARLFIHHLVEYLQLEKGSKVLDLACGRGRHSVYLHQLGLDVTGLDLSPENILYAGRYAEEGLRFAVHDMRRVYPEKFDAVFNLFTSFGYFEDKQENYTVISAIAEMLNDDGIVVIDYLNPACISSSLQEGSMTENAIDFTWKKERKEDKILKYITVQDQGVHHQYIEKVTILTRQDFERMFSNAGLHIEQIFGDYHLQPYVSEYSERLIVVGRKK